MSHIAMAMAYPSSCSSDSNPSLGTSINRKKKKKKKGLVISNSIVNLSFTFEEKIKCYKFLRNSCRCQVGIEKKIIIMLNSVILDKCFLVELLHSSEKLWCVFCLYSLLSILRWHYANRL